MVTERPRLKSRREAAGVEVSEVVERGDRPWWRQVHSGALLIALVVGIGLAAAAVIGVVALGLAALIDRALG